MPLIPCKECANTVSSFALACPRCGYPVATDPLSPAFASRVQTIEQTGKKYKLGMMLSYLPIIVGIAAFLGTIMIGRSNPSTAGLVISGVLFFGGVITHFVFRGLAWWHHG